VQLNGRIPTRDQYADVYQQRTIKLSQKVHVPIKDKKFNYVGKLLGPKGNSLRRLQEETQCKIVILGRFSMKDRAREEELRNSADAKYAHLNLPPSWLGSKVKKQIQAKYEMYESSDTAYVNFNVFDKVIHF